MGNIYIIYGVSGCGKTTVGKLLAKQFQIPFFDADDYHPKANVAKMSQGTPLTDADRVPWLDSLHNLLIKEHQKKGAVLACSALKEDYRNQLAGALDVHWIHLKGDYKTISERMANRSHYMPESLLKSQFDTLEVADYGLNLSISKSPEKLVKSILEQTKSTKKPELGIYGMGVMGRSLALNFASKGISVSIYNRKAAGEENLVAQVEGQYPELIYGAKSLKKFVNSLQKPKRILLMVPAGPAVDQVIEQLKPHLKPGAIIIDGGNSHYSDTQHRFTALKKEGIEFLGMGVSGGEQGALHGPSLMPGGSNTAFKLVRDQFKAIAAKDANNKPCVTFVGEGGSGHYVKMIHNGIEYGEMQLLAEATSLLKNTGFNNLACAELFEKWNKSNAQSYLLGIMPVILRKKEGGKHLLDLILDKAGNKGTGAWSSNSALSLGIPATIMTAAVFARYTSAQKETRLELAPAAVNSKKANNINPATLLELYSYCRKLNHLQGLELIQTASAEYNWNINLAEVTRIWSEGCIIKSELLNNLSAELAQKQLPEIRKIWFAELSEIKPHFKTYSNIGLDLNLPLPCFNAGLQYSLAMSQADSSANIIQALRDNFGAHTYKRVDYPESEYFHTNWNNT